MGKGNDEQNEQEAVEICAAYLGNWRLGNRFMAFGRLAWWLTEDGAAELHRLEEDPAWNRLVVIGFDARGMPLQLSPGAEADILETLRAARLEPLPLTQADASVAQTLSGLTGHPIPAVTRREKARVDMLRRMYDDRRKGWHRPTLGRRTLRSA